MKLRFGWMKFSAKKNSRPWPGFVYPPDTDGHARAQKVTSDGYVADTKDIFLQYDENVPENEKSQTAVKALNKFNEKFKFTFV